MTEKLKNSNSTSEGRNNGLQPRRLLLSQPWGRVRALVQQVRTLEEHIDDLDNRGHRKNIRMSHLVPLPIPCPVQLGSMKADTSGSQLHQFVREGNHTKVKKVLKKGAAVDTRNNLGQTPLFIAALLDLVKVVDVLLEFGANPNHRCEDRSTPVHAAAFSCNQWILSKLLDAGGDLRLNDKDGRIPRTWAKSAGKERSTRILEFMQRCALHMQGITQQIVCSNTHRVGCSSQALIRNPSILNKITLGNKDMEFLNISKDKSISSQRVQCFGFGKFCLHGPAQLAYLASIPIVNEKELVQADDEPTFSYTNGPYTTMTNLTWNGIRVTVKHMNLPTHQNCSKRLSADLLIAEQEYCSQLRHPNFLMLMAVCQMSDLDQIRLVYERVNLGSLYGVLHERRSEFPVLLMETIVQIILQITDAVLFLHSRGYIHRAITSHAVQLILPSIAKLSNFEFMIESIDGGTHSNLSQFPIPSQFYNWLAPEIIRGKPATFKSDVYSICTLIQELLTDIVPWEDLDGFAVKELIAAGRYLTVDEQVPKPYYDIVQTGIQPKPKNRTMNLQDIRFILRNDIKDIISNQQKYTLEKVQSKVESLYDDIDMSVAASSDDADFRKEQIQVQEVNASKGRKPEHVKEAQITAENDHSYYNLGRSTSLSPKKESELAGEVIDLNTESSQQITVLYDCWRTEQNQTEDTAMSGIQAKVCDKDKLSKVPWNEFEQAYGIGRAESQRAKHETDVLEQLHELDLALEQEMYGTSDSQPADDDLETSLLHYDSTGENSEEDSSVCLQTTTEYASDEENEQFESRERSGVEDLASDQEKQSVIASRALSNRVLEEEKNSATNMSIQHSISSCAINIQTSKHLLQQAFSALDHIKRGYKPEVNKILKIAEEAKTHDLPILEIAPNTQLPGFDEVDYQKKSENGNRRSNLCNDSRLVIPIAVAPPGCYQLPVYKVRKRHGADPVVSIQPASKVLSWTQGDHTSVVKACSNILDVLKTSDTYADGTQTTCLLKKQVNDEESGNSSAMDKHVASLSEHKRTLAMKSKKKKNILAHAHHQDAYPTRSGHVSMRIPAEGNQQEYRKQSMYLSDNRRIHITQRFGHERPLVYSTLTDEVTDVIEKMASGCLPAAQGEPEDNSSPHISEEELFRHFAKLPWQYREHRQHHNSNKERKGLELGHQQMGYSSHKNASKDTLIESDSSAGVEEIFQSFAGQNESFDSQLSGCSEEEMETTNLNKTFITRRMRKKVQKSTSFEEELEITTAIYQKNASSSRSSSSFDTDGVVEGNRSKDEDQSSCTPSSGVDQTAEIGKVTDFHLNQPGTSEGPLHKNEISFSDIQDLSCIPSDEQFTNHLLLSKTPLSTSAPFSNSTPYSNSTGHSQHPTEYEPMPVLNKILETSLWPSPESSAISPGTFATACDETDKIQSPTTVPETQPTTRKAVGSVTTTFLSEPVSEKLCAAPPSSLTPRTDTVDGQVEEVAKLSELGVPSDTLAELQVVASGMPGMLDKNKQNQVGKVNQMPEGITSGEIVQETAENQQEDEALQEVKQEASQGMLEHPSDWERCSLQKSLEETERAHSTLDGVLEEILELQNQPKEKINKMQTNTNNSKGEEDLSVSQKEECPANINQTNISTAEGETEGITDSRISRTGASVPPAGSLSEENRNQIQRANWNQPHRVIILDETRT
ncbi:inactive serine/threonine-protein kinase TEX14-like [Chiloscyllium plagiosum]|uniref:inactive serine/threonine-protein kinase TEX14-like n=1 Tax=Chiloscyllium plagiosum TaxID=36176 RepID=UPI001CB7DA7C|nr:inactive serine/threonine-protein kinase TEX14-like [Chiloscyllium plagiosum]